MSKAALRKELITFTSEQLVEVILGAYASSKEAKDYFEFFLNPDADALMDKKLDIITRELARGKWGASKARISVIRKTIKEYDAFGVGSEKTHQLMAHTIRHLLDRYRYIRFSEPLLNGTLKLIRDFIIHANNNALLAPALEHLRTLIDDRSLATPRMRDLVRNTMTDTIEQLAGA